MALVARLREAAEGLITVIEPIDPEPWAALPGPRVWSIGKEAAHVVEATVHHEWIVRLTIGQKVPSRRPAIERSEMTTPLSPLEVVELIRQRTKEGVSLLKSLTDEQLDLPTRPPRARGKVLAETIEHVLIGHYHTHRQAIEAKLASPHEH